MTAPLPARPLLSIVVPVFNEDATIPLFVTRMTAVLDGITPDWEILFVDDGSRDATLDRIRAAHAADGRVRGISFSRNFGKEVALSAGLDHAAGRAVVPIDVDLQDPPELIPEMVARWRGGADVVLAQRRDRSSDSWAKRVTARWFYRLIGRMSRTVIPPDVGDFRLIDARVVAALRTYRERERFMKGIFADVGFATAILPYARAPRAAGETKFRPLQLLRLAIEGIVSFSAVPLKIWTYIGLVASLAAVLFAAFIVARTLFWGADVPGYASIIVIMLLMNGLTLIGLGIQGEYVARIFSEVKARPLYLVQESIGLATVTPETTITA